MTLAMIISGCSQIPKPDRFRAGIVHRRIAGSFSNIKKFKVKEVIPLYRLQANSKINESLDAFARVDFVGGKVKASPLKVWVDGKFISLGTGISYFPFEREHNPTLSLDAGIEAFYASYDMRGDIGPFKSSVHDRLFGFGANLGATLEYECDDKLSFFTSAGYNFTQNFGSEADANFDGPYAFFGLKIKLP